MVVDNNFYMNLAIKEAWKYQGLTYPNPAVGCCIVGEKGEILSVEAHKFSGAPHAEVEALKYAYYKLTSDSAILDISDSFDIHTYLINNAKDCFNGVSIYTTLEPCSHVGKTPSCATLISKLGINTLYVGSQDLNEEAAGGNQIIQDSNIDLIKSELSRECDDLVKPFNLWRKDRFVFFKWAQRLNGTVDDGTISSEKSRKNVHAMRDVCDLLVVGGNTVRVDRPTLDSRMVDGKAPDVLIISKRKEFDTTIPLFGVKNRKVIIADNFDELKNYKNIMIEGGSNMFELTRDIVDYYLCYIAPKIAGNSVFNKTDKKFKILNVQKEEQDIIMWMK